MKSDLEKLAFKIARFLIKNECAFDSNLKIYFEGKRLEFKDENWKIKVGVEITGYVRDVVARREEIGYKQIIAMTFEGSFGEIIRQSGNPFLNEEKILGKFYELLEKDSFYIDEEGGDYLVIVTDSDFS